MKHEGRDVLYPKILRKMFDYYNNGLLDCYFAIEEEMNAQLNKHGGRKHGNYKEKHADCDTKH